jgi:hypothetical protein
MIKTDLYHALGMDKFFRGDSFELDISKEDSSSEAAIFELLDKVCLSENRTPLNGSWNRLSLTECSKLLSRAFQYDLAYTSCELMSSDKAQYYREIVMSKVDSTKCFCYTNWGGSPWESSGGAGWDPITENTFDMAIVLIDTQKIVFTYFISED